ncbi:hypothetical protein KR50_09240 [Jeotgalibacillus campisalis]|uniref:Uncharacterized protein n=1 Tax=Jeotgalibacillus campisalis TaxID=220754 RepID=A0A0C2SAT6_9BACL|nr:hypothetical protein KR50_09240 [Jeotgalibacillus campisalis]
MISQFILVAFLALAIYTFFTKEASAAKILAVLSFAGSGVLLIISLIGSYRMRRDKA